MKLRRLIAIGLLLFAGSAEIGGAQTSWRILARDKFNVYFQEADSLNAERVSTVLRDEYPVLASQLRTDVSAPIGVFIAADQNQFVELTGGAAPHWGEAVALPAQQVIILKSPRWAPATPLSRVTITHELVHILVGNVVTRLRPPRWLSEGLAIYFSSDTRYFDTVEVSRAQLAEQLIPLEKIDHMLAFGPQKAQLAYQQSFLAVVYLVDVFGEEILPLLLTSLEAEADADVALKRTIGLSVLEFEADWRAYLKEKYSWSFLLEAEQMIWLGIVVLFFAAFVAVVLRKRRRLAEWAAEAEGSDSEI